MRSIQPEEGQQPDTDLREITFKKNNYGPVSANIVLRYQNGLFLPVPGMSSLDQAARDAKADDAYLKVLRHLSQQGQDLGPNRTASNYAPKLSPNIPTQRGYARMNSKPRNSACSTPTGSTSLMLAPIPNVANTSRSFQDPSDPLPRPVRSPPIPPGPGTGAESLEASSPGSGLAGWKPETSSAVSEDRTDTSGTRSLTLAKSRKRIARSGARLAGAAAVPARSGRE